MLLVFLNDTFVLLAYMYFTYDHIGFQIDKQKIKYKKKNRSFESAGPILFEVSKQKFTGKRFGNQLNTNLRNFFEDYIS